MGSLLGYEVFLLGRRNAGWRTMSPTRALVPGFGVPAFVFLVVCLLPGYFLRRKHAQEEQEIVDALQRVVMDDVQS